MDIKWRWEGGKHWFCKNGHFPHWWHAHAALTFIFPVSYFVGICKANPRLHVIFIQ